MEGYALVRQITEPLGDPWRPLMRVFLLPGAMIYYLIKPLIEGIWEIMPAPLKQFIEFLKTLTADIWQGFLNFLKDPVGTLNGGWNFIAGKVGEIGAGIKTAFEGAYAWFHTNIADPVMSGIGQIGGWVAEALKGVASALGEGLQGFWNWIYAILGQQPSLSLE